MARITEMPRGIEPVWIHDVTHPVGLNWFGYKDDVKLLQYGLNKVMAKVPFPDLSATGTIGPMGREYPPMPPLKVDGIFGKKSHAAFGFPAVKHPRQRLRARRRPGRSRLQISRRPWL